MAGANVVALGVHRFVCFVDRVHDRKARTNQFVFVRAILAPLNTEALEIDDRVKIAAEREVVSLSLIHI